jgi:ceramide glucosyltransferase
VTAATFSVGFLIWWRAGILALACVPLIYYLIAIFAGWQFFRRRQSEAASEFAPPVSVLKPVRGVDFASYENFRSFCMQDYPRYEILFCVNDLNDTAVPLIRRIADEFPQLSIRLLSGAAQLGSNRKVNNLALLAREAKYEVLVQSDADVRVGPQYLKNLVKSFAQSDTGVVSCFYRGITEGTLWGDVEALGAATDFAPSVLVANLKEGITFALGASVATTKTWLRQIGGYEALANVLADDYEIGNRVAKAGGRVTVSHEIVETMYPAINFSEFWAHQSRWARTVRLCRPFSYVGLLFTHGLPLAIVGAWATGSWRGAVVPLSSYLLLRLTLAWVVGVRGLQDQTAKRKLALVPFRDAMHFCVWLGSFFSNRITWGEAEFRLASSGEMIPVERGRATPKTPTGK